ncbi:MAG: hypothetical protein R2727_02455 [Bacteroidales bacterium]
MKLSKLFLVLAAVSLMVSSCEKNGSELTTDDINLADDDAVAEFVFDDIFNTAESASLLLEGSEKSLDGLKGSTVVLVSDSCPTVSVELVDETVRVITVDYGEGCTGFYGQTRSGKIIITQSGRRITEGSFRTVTFDNYIFNDIVVEGTKVTTNQGLNDNQNMVFSTTLTGGKLIFPDETVVEREFSHEREWIAGFMTINPWDDECLVTGTATGINYNGVSYQNEITSALYWKRICPFFVSGTISITRDGADPVFLDYGDGECDEYATITRGEDVREIILRKRFRVIR